MKEFPLTLPQRDIYFDQLTLPGTPIYNIGARIIIDGELDPVLMEQAYRTMIDQHETFHSSFVTQNGIPFMRVLDEYRYNWRYYDCSGMPDPIAAADEFCEADFRKPFDLDGQGPLNFFCLIRIGGTTHWLYSRYHHLITDGWGASLLFQRLTGFYNSLKESGGISENYDLSYSALLDSEAEYLKSDFTPDVEYWKERLSGRQVTALPGHRKDMAPEGSADVSGREVLYLKRERYNRISSVCSANRVSVFHFWTAALAVYFCRTYRLEDITIGLPLLNRGSSRFKQTVGTFTMITPLLTEVGMSSSFKELMTAIRSDLKRDYKHQRLPLRDIAGAIHQAGQREEKLYQIFFSYEKHDYSASFSGCTTRVVPMTHNMERVPLAVYVREFDEQEDVKIDFDHNYSYFDRAMCRRLIGHFQVLIDAVLADPDLTCSEIPFLTAAEERRIFGLTRPGPDVPIGGGSFLNRFWRQAILEPQMACVVYGSDTLSYQEVIDRSGGIAAFLEARGIGAGTVVALLVERSAEMLLLMLGILQTKAAHLCIDPDLPAARIRYILEDSGARLLVTQKKFRHLMPDPSEGPEVLFWEECRGKEPIAGNMPDGNGPDDAGAPAYILYTSGSTGRPKGVVVSHMALLNFLTGMQGLLGIASGDRLLAVTTYSFDISLLELYLPLVTGATVIIAGKQHQQDPFKMKALIDGIEPNILQATPAFWSLLIDAGWKGQPGLKALCGGESLSRALAEQLLARTAALWNVYGPTEATIWSTIQRITSPDEYRLIGRPIPNTEVYILDNGMKPVPEGIDGEIYLGGAGLASGYNNNEQLTAERFVPHPFRSDGGRLYKTGDIGRWLANGAIAYSGRSDHQVKIRGYRIELAEIENVLLLHPAVKAAAVIVKENKEYDKQLIAFIAPAFPEGGGLLRAYVAGALPKYMLPDQWHLLDKMPLTASGKIDRKMLETLLPAEDGPGQETGQPLSDPEIALLEIWRQVLQCPSLSPEADFFELGGNSFKIISLITSIQRRLLVSCSFTDVFTHPAFRDLARLIAEKVEGAAGLPFAVAAEWPYVLTGFQQYILRVSRQREGSLSYTLFDAWPIHEPLDPTLVQKACYLLMERHEMLRTVIGMEGETPVLNILTPGTYPRTFSLHHALDTDGIVRTITAINRKPMSLEKGPLWEMVLFPVRTGGNVLFARLHHLICDGASLDVFVRDLFDCYRCLSANKGWTPPDLGFQFKEYTAWRQQVHASDQYRASASFWRNVFTVRPTCTFLPGGNPDTRWLASSFKGRVLQLSIHPSLRSRMEKQARDHKTSTFVVALAAFFRLLHDETSNSDITICIPVSGRESTGMEDQIGVFTNTIPLRVQVSPRESTGMLIDKVKSAFLSGYEHHDYQLHQLAEQVEEMHGIIAGRLFNMMLNYQYRKYSVADELVDGAADNQRLELVREWSKLDLSMNFYESPASLLLEMECRTDLCTEEQSRRLLKKFVSFLELNATAPEAAATLH